MNGALCFETQATASTVLEKLIDIEQTLGRQRGTRWGPRTVDLDLLLFGSQTIQQPTLTVPHPWLAIRAFVLEPAAEVAGAMVHPQIGWDISRLWKHLCKCRPFVAVTGIRSKEQRAAVHAAGHAVGAELLSVPSRVGWNPPQPIELPDQANCADEKRELRKLANDCLEKNDGQPIVSDFWWESGSVVLADSGNLNEPSKTTLEGGALADLVVVLVQDEKNLGESDRQSQQALVASATRKERGPFLLLAAEDLKRVEHDIAAAVRSMQSTKSSPRRAR